MSFFSKMLGWMKAEKPKAKDAKPEVKAEQTAAVEGKPKKAKPSRKRATPAPVTRKIDEERISRVILSVRMSEKSVGLASESQHVLEVLPDATRAEVKSAVETLMDVEVDHVRITNVRGKAKRKGRRKNWSKAYVRLAPGQTIEGVETGA